jgi:hypothetical protein
MGEFRVILNVISDSHFPWAERRFLYIVDYKLLSSLVAGQGFAFE